MLEPSRAAWLVAIHQLSRPCEPLRATVPSGEPRLRSEISRRLWAIICMAQFPVSKSEWLDRAKVFGKRDRILGSSAVHNFVKHGHCYFSDGKFRRAR